MNEQNKLKDEILARIAGGEEGDYQILTKCCRTSVRYEWGGGGAWMNLVCTGCGKINPEIIIIE